MRWWTTRESIEVRYRVCLIVRTSGSSAACSIEPFDARGEALVRVVDEEIGCLDRREHVGRLVLVGRDESGRDDRGPGLGLEVGPFELDELPQARVVEHPADLEGFVGADAEAASEDLAQLLGHGPLNLESDGFAEAPAPELLLDSDEQVIGLVLIEGQVRVSSHAEQVMPKDLHALEQDIEVRPDDLVEEGVPVGPDRLAIHPRQLHEAWQHGRDLDPGEPSLVRLGVPQRDGDREGQAGDVRERMAGSTASGVRTG